MTASSANQLRADVASGDAECVNKMESRGKTFTTRHKFGVKKRRKNKSGGGRQQPTGF